MKWFTALSFDEKTRLAREFGLILFRAGLNSGLFVIFAGLYFEWTWEAYAVGIALAANLVLLGYYLALCVGCLKNPTDLDQPAPPAE